MKNLMKKGCMKININNGTAQGVVEFLDSLIKKGRATSGTVAPLKAAFKRILSQIDGDNWETVEISKIDTTDYISRFKVLTKGKINKASYIAYKQRLEKANAWYKNFLTNPAWTPPQSKIVGKKSAAKGEKKKINEMQTDNGELNSNVMQTESKTEDDFASFNFPLLNGKLVSFYFPKNLKLDDAKRIHKFVDSLVVNSELNPNEQTTNYQ
jgi:hypothetical protein